MRYLTVLVTVLTVGAVGVAASRLEFRQRPDVQCAQVWVDGGGQNPDWCPKKP